MIPALFTSSSALDASQSMISVVGNNLANSNTAGFKSQTLLFSDQFAQLLSTGSGPTSTNGGSNPIQVGMGVQVAATDTNETQGTFQSTGNPLDMAIQNSGYFVLKNGSQTVYTRAGSFSVDANGSLIDPATGSLVQRVGTVGEGSATTPSFQVAGNSNIQIPTNLTIPGSATQNINFTGNLSATATGPLKQVLTLGQALTVGGKAASLTTSLDALDQTSISTNSPTGFVAGDKIDITGTTVDGSPVNAVYTLTGNPAQDTVGSLMSAINQAFQAGTPATGARATLNSNGQIVLTANQAGPSSASLTLSTDEPSVSGTATQFSTFVQTVAGAAGTTATTVIQVYDSQGTPHNVTFTFEKQANNQWSVTAALSSKDGTITGFGEDNTVNGLTFNANGSLSNITGNSTSEVLTTAGPLTSGGAAATASTLIDSLDQHTGSPYGPNDTIVITGTDYNGHTITPVSVPASGLTLGGLVNAINTAYNGAVATLDSSGNIELTGSHAGQAQLGLSIADSSTNTGGSTSFAKFVQTTPGTNGDANIAFQINNLGSYGTAQVVHLNFGLPGSFTGVTQTGSGTSIAASSQDGYAQGTLQSTTVNTDGVIVGQFSNGQTENIAQIALATFSNPQGLQNAGNNYFTYTTSSGLPTISAPGTGSAGTIQSGGLEGSNVDIGTEFTQLIAAQQGYEVNAKAFSVANSLMQAAVNLIQ